MSGAGMSGGEGGKRAAAEAAVLEVRDGSVLGLGTGSTAALMIEALGRRVAGGLRVRCIATSERSAAQARGLGIAMTDFAADPVIDLTIDGADEVRAGTLDLVKGLGGALLREKIVASASRRMVVIVDAGKVVGRLGQVGVPVEVVAFGWETTAVRLRGLGVEPRLRVGAGGVFRTDGGNVILDCGVEGIEDAGALEGRLKAVTGVVETGLFVGLATSVIVGSADGVQRMERT